MAGIVFALVCVGTFANMSAVSRFSLIDALFVCGVKY